MSKNKPVGVAAIGCGYWGPNIIRNLHQSPNANLIACCDRSDERLTFIKERFPDVELLKDADELLKNDRVEAVAIATPINTHFDLAKKCLEAGKHVMIEKPITGTSEEAEELIKISDARGLILMVGHTFEYNAGVRKVKELIDGGEIGDLFYIHMTRASLGLFQQDKNVFWDLATHDLAILFYLTGTLPESVFAQGSAFVRKEIEEIGNACLTFPGNIMAAIHVSWMNPSKIRQTTVVGSKKMIVYDDINNVRMVEVYDKGVVAARQPDGFGEFQLSYRYGDIHTPFIDNREPLSTEIETFLNSVRTGEAPQSDGHSGLNVVKTLEAIDESLKTGAKVNLAG